MQDPLKTVTDQMGRKVTFAYPPKRIVSLVPSQTELLYSLGLAGEVAGQTLFCIHPLHMHESKPRVGGTKNFKPDKIAALAPDLIIGNKEENEQGGIEELARHYPVWMSDIQTLDDALDMMRKVGEITGKASEGEAIAAEVSHRFSSLKDSTAAPLTAAYLIWRKPWMVAGHSTFITEMMERIGLANVFGAETSRYPEVSGAQLAAIAPQVILLSSEPYPFKQKHLAELRELCPQSRILLVDGELFSWYGSRLLHSVEYFKELRKQINAAK